MAPPVSVSSSSSSRRRTLRPRRGLSWSHVASFLLGCCVSTMCLNVFHGTLLHQQHEAAVLQSAHQSQPQQQQPHKQSHHVDAVARQEHIFLADDQHHETHELAGLDCSAHGGPSSQDATKEMVYWKDLSLDNEFVSPLHYSKTPTQRRQYLTFEPDGGGWNNIRMSMETVLVMAVAMGRVLVLPPSQKMYLLGSKSFSFADFFPLQAMAQEHPGLEIISMEQFLRETVGHVINLQTQNVTYPSPTEHNKTDWNGDSGVKTFLNPWLQSVAWNPDWNPEKCLAAFPKSTDPLDAQALQDVFDQLQQEGNLPKVEDFINQPTPVNASVQDRMAEFVAGRTELCLYTPEMQQAQILHFHGKRNLPGGRLLVHFYAFLFFQDYHQDLWMKRFVRDHVRYLDDIECAAARVVQAVREHSRNKHNHGVFDSMHVRRGDFQYKKTRVDANEILEASQEEIPKGATVYIGTDERRKDFFNALKDHGWDVVFLDDFLDLASLRDLNPNYYGMIDQLVTSRGRTFFGCWFSTFTGYITRLRGYHSQNEQNIPGYEMGLLPNTYYYALKDHKTKLHDFWPIKKLFYAREYPTSWRNLDFDAA